MPLPAKIIASPQLRVGLRHLATLALLTVAMVTLPAQGQDPVTGSWTLNNNGNWSATANWSGGIVPGLTTNPTGGVGDIANILNNISANRTITIDAGVPGTNVVLGTLNIGDSSGGQSFTITGGTLTFDAAAGNALLNMADGGGSITISSLVTLNDTLDITLNDISNNQGITLSGAISGGVAGTTTVRIQDLSVGTSLNWVILNAAAGNTFQGQVLVESGLLRYDGNNSVGYAGALGVGNETIIMDGAAVDLRDHDFNPTGDLTEIFRVRGTGANGLGALRNTTGTGNVAHVVMEGDTLINSQSAIVMDRRMDTGGVAGIAPILDFGGHDLTKVGLGDLIIRGGDLRNLNGRTLNIYEAELRFEERGELTGGGSDWNVLDGLTINVSYNRAPYNNVDLTVGSRTTTDLYGVNANQTELQGNGVAQSRLSFGVYWGASVTGTGTIPEQTKFTKNIDNVTINLNNGTIQREGNTDAGRTFDQIFGPTVTFNLVGGGMGRDSRGSGNLFSMDGGSSAFNSTTGLYDFPGAFEIQGQIDNTTGGNAGTGFTVRGSRELRLTGDNANFDGDILVKNPTNRWVPANFTTSTGATETAYTNLSLAGANGSLNQANSITLTRMGSLGLLNNSANSDYASANNNDRLNDNGFLNMRNGVLKLETDVTVTNTENFGNLVADLGTNFLYLETRAGGRFDGSLQSFERNNGGILKVINTNGAHTWGTGSGDDRLAVVNASGISTVGDDAPGTVSQRVVQGIFGGSVPTSFTPGTGGGAAQTNAAIQNAYAYHGVGLGLMTLDNGFLRPLTSAEYSAGSTPTANSNWLVNAYLGTETQYIGNRDIWPGRNVLSDITVNTLTIAHDPAASGQAIVLPVSGVDTSKDYVIIDTGATLKINSGIINFSTFVEAATANTTPVIRGGRIDMNGQQAIINSASSWHDLDTTSGTGSTIITANSAFIRSHITNAVGFVKTGRSSLYLDTWNDIAGNVYISDQGSLILRHPGALGDPAPDGEPRREVIIGGTGSFLLEYGTNVTGLDIRATNSFDTTRVVLRNEGTTHSSWTGDVIIDGADGYGNASDASYTITARNNGTLTLYGNIYTDNNQNLSDDDSFADPPLVTTSIGETYTLNLRGQVRDVATGNLGSLDPNITSVFRTGDSSTRLDSNHSLRFQMSGHDEGNVNVHQQWSATGRVDMRQGYFRILYDPTQPGANGFLTDSTRALLAPANDYFGRYVLGADGTSATSNYHTHLALTRDGQVFNAPFIYSYNDNRQGTQSIVGENDSGTVYFGSIANDLPFSLQFTNQSTERDMRFLQVRGGSMVFNGRLDDENGTVESFNSVATIIGPGNVTFNANLIGNSDIDRWNFLGGVTTWGTMTANNQFARTGSTNGSRSGFGGGHLVLASSGAARTQTLDGNVYLIAGASSITTNQNTTLTLGAAARTVSRGSGASLALFENGNGVINLSGTGLSATAGDFLGAWALYGNTASGVTDWAARQGTTGVQAFAGYANDTFGTGNHTNITGDALLAIPTEAETLRIGVAGTVDLSGGGSLTLNQGSILIPTTVTSDVTITGGSVTSGWTSGGNDLALHNYGEGRTSVFSVIADNGANKVNFVHSGSGTTALQSDNTFTGEHYFNGGVVEISSESQLGDINGSVARLVRVNNGTNNGVSVPADTPLTVSGGGAGTGLVATFQTDSAGAITGTDLGNGGSGYTSGLYLNSLPALNGNGTVWAVLDSGNLHFNGGTLRVTDNISLDGARTIFLGTNGGALDVAAGKSLTINGYITSELSHAHSGNGYTTINHLGIDDEPASNRNPDIGDLIIQGGGTVSLTGAPDGTVRASMFNSYGGITWINEGTLRLASAGSSASGILGTNRSWIDGTVIGANGSLQLNTASDATFLEWITFRGQGYEGGGTIQTAGTARTYRLAGQLFLEDEVLIRNFNASNIRFNESGGAMYGTGDIRRIGSGALQMYGNSPDWTGSIINGSGDFYVISVGNLQGMPSLTLERNSIFYFDSGTQTIDEFRNRLRDDLTVNSDGYIRMRLRPTGGVHSGEEKIGAVNVVGGQLGVEFDIGADVIAGAPRVQGDFGFWSFDSINRSAGASVHLRPLDAGVEFANSAFGVAQTSNVVGVKIGTVPALAGSGDGSNGNAQIAQGFFGGIRPLWNNLAGTGNLFPEAYISDRLVTIDTITATGETVLRPLLDSEYKIVGSPNTALTSSSSLLGEGITGDQNLRLVGVTDDTGIGAGEMTDRRNSLLRLETSASVNSLTFASETFINGSAAGRGNFTALTIGPGAELTVNSGMIVSASRAVQNRNGVAHDGNVNADIRNAINGGTLNFNNQDAHFNLNDLWVHFNTAESANVYHATDADNALLLLNSTIKNAGDLIKTGPISLFLQSHNEYTRNTYINEGAVYARTDQALGQGSMVFLQGGGGIIAGRGANISGKTIHIGKISGTNLGLALQEGASWRGDIVVDNIDSVGGTSYIRTFTPRIYNDHSYRSAIFGDIFGGDSAIASSALTDSRLFTTYDTSSFGILEFRGQIRDTASGAVSGPIDSQTANRVLRMEIVSDNNAYNVAFYQQHDAAGRIRLLQGILTYEGTGNFYTDEAASTINANPLHPMLGLQMGGRSAVSGDGDSTGDNLALFLGNAGSTLNLDTWQVGVDIVNPDNTNGLDNYGRGNTTGNSTLGGLNHSGTVTFGTGLGSIIFTESTRQTTAYSRDLRLFAQGGGEVDMRVNLVDGGDNVNSSITKIGAGQVNLLGSSAGAGTVEAVNVLGGSLTLAGYGVNAQRRVGSGASLLLGGGTLIMDGSTAAAPLSEDFAGFTINAGGSAVASAGPNALITISGVPIRNTGGQVHFQSVAGGVIRLAGVGPDSLIGAYATFGASLDGTPTATDWAATDALGNVVAFADYSEDAFAPGNQTDVVGAGLAAGTTGSVRFDDAAGTISSGALVLEGGGVLITSNYAGGAGIGAGVGVMTGGGSDLIIQNFGSGIFDLAGDISGSQAVVFNGIGTTALTGSNTYTGVTYVTGAARVTFDALTRFGGTPSFHLNGGSLVFTGSAANELIGVNILLGGAGGTVEVSDAASRVILRGTASNQISSEVNVIGYNSNPFSGGLNLLGPGTIQFGNRSAANNATDLLGVVNNYTGLTTIGDGSTAVRVDIQSQPADNNQSAPFGSSGSWADSTLLRNNATLEFSMRRGDGSRDGQVRFREWFQVGEQAGDVVTFDGSTGRQPTLDGQINVIGTLIVNSRSGGYSDAGGTQNSEFLFNTNEGGLFGSGDIVKIGDGTLRFYQPLREWTGDLDIRDGLVGIQSYQTSFFEPNGLIYIGDPDAVETSAVQIRVEPRFGNNVSQIDSGTQNMEISRDIVVRDNIRQAVRIAVGYGPETNYTFSGDINVGSGSIGDGGAASPSHVRFYNEDTTGMDGALTGHSQHVFIIVNGNLSGSNNVMFDSSEGGSANDDVNDQFTTLLLAGNNAGFTGKLTIGPESGAGTGNFDRDDNEVLRFGSNAALSSSNVVEMRNLSTMQVGGASVDIGNLVTNDGTSSTGLYSFSGPTWDPGRSTTADLTPVNVSYNGASGTLHGGSGTLDYSPLGGSSAIVENAAPTDGTLRINQSVDTTWDVLFRDGVPDQRLNPGATNAGSLSLEKHGTGSATLTIYNTYTGTTAVNEGVLQVGQGGDGTWGLLVQGGTSATTAMGNNGNRAVGSTGSGTTLVGAAGTLTGSGHVRGNLDLHGTLAPGDAGGGFGPGGNTGTLFIGNGSGAGNFTIRDGSLVMFQASSATALDSDLNIGTYTIEMGTVYEDYVSLLFVNYFDTAVSPSGFGQTGTEISAGQHDHLEIGGSVTWQGGTIQLDAGVGFNPNVGEIYNLMDWYGIADWTGFDTGAGRYLIGNGDDSGDLLLPDLSALNESWRWDTGLLTTHGILLIATVPEPSKMLLVCAGLAAVLLRRRRGRPVC